MMQEVERGAPRARSLLQVPDSECAEGSLRRVALEPVVEQLSDRHRENAGQVDDRLLAEPADVEAQGADARELARIARLDIWGRREVELFEDPRERAHALAELRPFRRVSGADATNRLDRATLVARQLEGVAAVERHGEPRIGLLEPQLTQAQIANHAGRHPANIGGVIRHPVLVYDDDTAARARGGM